MLKRRNGSSQKMILPSKLFEKQVGSDRVGGGGTARQMIIHFGDSSAGGISVSGLE